MSIVVRPEAEDELTEAFRWYEERSTGLGFEFIRTEDACIASIERNPTAYPIVHGEIRRTLLRKFPHGIFYFISGEAVVIIACFHARRDPKQWQG